MFIQIILEPRDCMYLCSTHLTARTGTEKTHAVLQNHVHVSNKCGFINSCRFSTHIMGSRGEIGARIPP